MSRAHNFTQKQRTQMAIRANGCCEKCNAILKDGEGEADHIIPVEMYGESDLSNGQWLCRVCHRGKTDLDVRMIRRAQRRERLKLGAKKPSRMPGARNSKFKQKIGGGVVLRETGEPVR